MPSRPTLDSRPHPGQGLAGAYRSAESDGSAEYRRRARRLRGRFAGRLGTLHAALGDLARQEDSHRESWKPARGTESKRPRAAIARPVCSTTADLALGSVFGVASASAEHLARLVREALCGGVLPYTRRQAILRAARRLGVGRFQANLLIAAVQHRYGTPALDLPAVSLPAVNLSNPPNPSKGPMAMSQPRRAGGRWGWIAAVAAILAVEAAFVVGALSIAHL